MRNDGDVNRKRQTCDFKLMVRRRRVHVLGLIDIRKTAILV